MKEITFQFHITTSTLSVEQKELYIKLCNECNVKPVFILLPYGEAIRQPMFTALIKKQDFQDALEQANKISKIFSDSGFLVQRMKAEVFAEDAPLFTYSESDKFKPYYECHCKIKTDNWSKIIELAKEFGAHLSENSLEEGKKFLTIREYGPKERFYEKTTQLSNALKEHKITIIKEKFEHCIYDSKLELDRGWAY